MIALGFNAETVNQLIGLYGQIPSNVPTTVVVRDQATGQLQQITQAANGLDGRTVTLTVKQKFLISRTEDVPLSVFDGRAAGGAVAAGRTYLVGEVRPELFKPSVPGTIVPNTGGASNGGGGSSTHLSVSTPFDGQRIARAVALAQRDEDFLAGGRVA
jgi:hypothetical protein